MRRRIAPMGIVMAAALLVGAACVVFGTLGPGRAAASGDDRPISEILRETGHDGSAGDWADSLTDEQRAAIDTAYEADVAAGYEGTRDEWVAHRVLAHYDGSGGLVVVLPDGGEFTVPAATAGGRQTTGGGAQGRQGQQGQVAGAGDEGEGSGGGSGDEGGGPGDEGDEGGRVGTDGAQLEVATVRAHPGDSRVAVAVSVQNNPGILGMAVSVSYDEAALALVDAENGPAFRGVLSLTHARAYQSGCLFFWDGVEVTPDDVRDGDVLTLYFDVLGGAAAGRHAVAVRGDGPAFDNDLAEVGLSVRDGGVVVE